MHGARKGASLLADGGILLQVHGPGMPIGVGQPGYNQGGIQAHQWLRHGLPCHAMP